MKILIVDDHPLVPEALHTMLATLDADCEVLAATDLASAFERVDSPPNPDLVLLDPGLPGQSGLSALAAFRDARPDLPVVVISGDISSERVLAALDLGAMGFIPKTAKKDVLIDALRMILSGGIFVPRNEDDGTPETSYAELPLRGAELGDSYAELGFTERQAQVLALLLRGMTNKLICRELGLAEGTVKIHISAILKLLGVANRTQAVLAVSRIGLRI